MTVLMIMEAILAEMVEGNNSDSNNGYLNNNYNINNTGNYMAVSPDSTNSSIADAECLYGNWGRVC